MTFIEGTHRLTGFNTGADQFIRHRFTCGIFRITFQPVSIFHQAVAKHGLRFRIGHGRRREFLREAWRILADIGEVRRMAAFMEQRIQAIRATANLIRFRQAGEVNHRWHPFAVVIERRHRPVHKTIFKLAFAYQQIQLHFCTIKTDIQALEAVYPATQGISEREVRIELTGDVTGAGEADIPWQ
ncbi:hypothetical protein SRABI106_03694 [Rahnella aquatilis]|nr:hypothetical protein SRABI106_03694 [Rahnella aquatilis]